MRLIQTPSALLPRAGRILFATGILGIAVLHFIYRDFITGRAPGWPQFWPGGLLWAYLTGAIFIAISLSLILGKKARHAALVFALVVFLWGFLRQIPSIVASPVLSGAWTTSGKALVFVGGALAIAATYPKVKPRNPFWTVTVLNQDRTFIHIGRICLGIFLLITGIQHFMFSEFVASLIPGGFPGNALFWTYFTGVALCAGGIGLLIPWTASLAALFSGIMIFSWVWIVHLPLTMSSVSDNIAIFEAWAFSGVAFVLTQFPNASQGDKPR